MNLPEIALVRQTIPAPGIEDVSGSLREGLLALNLEQKVFPGHTVAVTAGSRGICDIVTVLREIVAFFRRLQAEPFVAAAMGSHGGATAAGQAQVLAGLGITAETIGAPVVCNMETQVIATGSFGQPVHVGKDFIAADHIVVVNRVKPHTSFRGNIESGLYKMMAIGMGKQQGASIAHQLFSHHGFQPVVLDLGGAIAEKLPILCGVALLENRLEGLARLHARRPEHFMETDQQLLIESRDLMGRVPFADIDLLVLDEMGKNISGSGMDSNVTGRIYNLVTPEPPVRQFRRIFVRALTPESDGNALGVGTADFVSRRLVETMDAEKTRINCVTAAVPEKGRIPLIYDHDREAVRDALASAGVDNGSAARLVWIKNTLELDYMLISQALAGDAERMASIQCLSPFAPMPFDAAGDLPFGCFDGHSPRASRR